MEFLNNIKLRHFDMYGVQFVFTTNKNRYFQSSLGAIMSIISIAVILSYSIILLQEEFQRTDPSILNQIFPDNAFPMYELNNSNFFLGFRLETDSAVIKDYSNYFTITAKVIQYKLSPDSWNSSYIMDFTYDNCLKLIPNDTANKDIDSNIIKGYDCFDFDNLKKNKIGLGGDFLLYPNITYGIITIELCNSAINPNCKSIDEIYNFLDSEQKYLAILLPTYTWSSQNNTYKNPLKRSLRVHYIPLNTDLFLYTSSYFNKVLSYDDQNDFYDNYVLEQAFYYDYHSTEIISAMRQNRFTNYVNGLLCQYEFLFTRNINSYKRRFLKIPGLLSDVGGLMSSLVTCLGFICMYYNIFHRNLRLMTEMFDFIDDEKNEKFVIEEDTLDNSIITYQNQNSQMSNVNQIQNISIGKKIGDGLSSISQFNQMIHKTPNYNNSNIELLSLKTKDRDKDKITDKNTNMDDFLNNLDNNIDNNDNSNVNLANFHNDPNDPNNSIDKYQGQDQVTSESCNKTVTLKSIHDNEIPKVNEFISKKSIITSFKKSNKNEDNNKDENKAYIEVKLNNEIIESIKDNKTKISKSVKPHVQFIESNKNNDDNTNINNTNTIEIAQLPLEDRNPEIPPSITIKSQNKNQRRNQIDITDIKQTQIIDEYNTKIQNDSGLDNPKQNKFFNPKIKEIYDKLKEKLTKTEKELWFPKLKIANDKKEKPLMQYGIRLLCKNFFCPLKLTDEEQRVVNTYNFCIKYFDEKLDIQNYLKTLDKVSRFKTIFLNNFQKLSLEHLKKKNLYLQEDRQEVQAEYELLTREAYEEKDIDELMTLILYFIDFLKKGNSSSKSFVDKKLINNLNPFLKSLIKEYK